MAKADITVKELAKWDQYKDKTPDEALLSIYAHIETTSRAMCEWYWKSIKTKRLTSQAARGVAFILLILGTSFPIIAATHKEPDDKLLFTQLAVAFLAVAGLTQLADKVFGWSSGWMRYITTVTTMENLTRAFQMEWAKYLVCKGTPVDAKDAKDLFDLANRLEEELTKLQAEETTKWVAEFNTGISLLDTMIKTQREETDKKLAEIRTSLTEREKAAKADEKLGKPGSLEVAITYKAEPKTISITLDDDAPVEFLGPTWTKLSIAPGHHSLKIKTSATPPRAIERVVEIKPDAVTKMEVKVDE
jgi:hypothetical protein